MDKSLRYGNHYIELDSICILIDFLKVMKKTIPEFKPEKKSDFEHFCGRKLDQHFKKFFSKDTDL